MFFTDLATFVEFVHESPMIKCISLVANLMGLMNEQMGQLYASAMSSVVVGFSWIAHRYEVSCRKLWWFSNQELSVVASTVRPKSRAKTTGQKRAPGRVVLLDGFLHGFDYT